MFNLEGYKQLDSKLKEEGVAAIQVAMMKNSDLRPPFISEIAEIAQRVTDSHERELIKTMYRRFIDYEIIYRKIKRYKEDAAKSAEEHSGEASKAQLHITTKILSDFDKIEEETDKMITIEIYGADDEYIMSLEFFDDYSFLRFCEANEIQDDPDYSNRIIKADEGRLVWYAEIDSEEDE